SARLIPAEPLAPVSRPPANTHGRPDSRATLADSDLSARIVTYLGRLPAGLSTGQHRDDYAYTFAAFLVRDLELSDEQAMAWMLAWDARNAVAKGEDRLREIIANAHAYGQRTYGSGLLNVAPRMVRRRNASRIRFSVRI